jgi:hypothetical protein
MTAAAPRGDSSSSEPSRNPGRVRVPLWTLWLGAGLLLLVGVVLAFAWPVLREEWVLARWEARGDVDIELEEEAPQNPLFDRLSAFPSIQRQAIRWFGAPNQFWLTLHETVPRSELKHLGAVRRIENLSLLCADLRDEDLEHYSRIGKLESLELASPHLTPKGLLRLRGLRVENVSLNHPGLGGDHLAAILRALPEIDRLDCSGSGIQDTDLELLRGHPKLEELYLSETAVTDAGLPVLGTLPKLEVLSLYRTKITGHGFRTWSAGNEMALLLGRTALTAEGLAALPALVKWECLDLSDTAISDEWLTPLTIDPKHLLLNRTRVRFEDKAVEWILSRKRLKFLSVAGLSIDPAAISRLRASGILDVYR